MRMRLLLFAFAQIVKELVTAWFLFSHGVFQLSHTYNVVAAVVSGVVMAALIITIVKISALAHTDPDPAWIGWLRFIFWTILSLFATALVLVQPLAGGPALALVLTAGWFAIGERRRDRTAADQHLQALPVVPQHHAYAARSRFGNVDSAPGRRPATGARQLGPDRSGLLDGHPGRGRRTGRALGTADTAGGVRDLL